MQKKFSPLKKFAFAILIGESFIIIPMLIFTAGKSVNLKCQRIEPKYVNCQQQVSNFYGLWSNAPTSFRLTGIELEEYVFKEDSPPGIYIYLQTHNQGEKLYFYSSNNLKTALTDKQRLEALLNSTGQSSLEIIVKDAYFSPLNFFPTLLGVNIIIIFVMTLALFLLLVLTFGYFFIKSKSEQKTK